MLSLVEHQKSFITLGSDQNFHWANFDSKFLNADNEDPNQTVRIGRLIRFFIGRRCQKVRLLMVRKSMPIPLEVFLMRNYETGDYTTINHWLYNKALYNKHDTVYL